MERPTETVTEDGKIVKEGDSVYNYYDMKPGVIVPGSGRLFPDPWFDIRHDDGTYALLNGQRICSMEYAIRRSFRGASLLVRDNGKEFAEVKA